MQAGRTDALRRACGKRFKGLGTFGVGNRIAQTREKAPYSISKISAKGIRAAVQLLLAIAQKMLDVGVGVLNEAFRHR